ncbi:hypothetical protein [Planctomicrobium piriforme]|uniref:Tetratricopeptide repeat-containing protein n=1 Tax=Planctomicrobium piriforme TaxID=1576369 RepID=A0A1I3PEM6_9PLAN|nr:hypothetical protein [Planctomicrobium piriforme]SFJ19466.1 hypothetical protein SAMN05421753_116115 [Planctomicrobium piriforme]
MPDLTTGEPRDVWDRFFDEHRPAPQLLSTWVLKLHGEKQYKQVIACLQSALMHGQGQPWMYEVLALSMEIENYPKADVERVVLSLADFGEVDYSTMMFSGAYLARFGRKEAALTLYRQASRMLPERSEPYVLGLNLVKDQAKPEDVEWAACGVLLNSWGTDSAKLQLDAENILRERARQLRQKSDEATAVRLEQALAAAKSRDITVRLDWNGAADLDLQVEEPNGAICSVQSPETQSGGLYLHDGVGPDAKNSYELYVCPRGIAGPYRITVKNAGGALVGNRATLTVTMLEGTKEQARIVRMLTLDGDQEVGLTFDLPSGRRTQPRFVSALVTAPDVEMLLDRRAAQRNGALRPDAAGQAARRDFEQSRAESAQRSGKAGAVGYAPVVQVIPEGSSLSGQAVVSPDRRYVRLGMQPVFSEIVDVFTFTYLNGGNGAATGAGGGNPANGR